MTEGVVGADVVGADVVGTDVVGGDAEVDHVVGEDLTSLEAVDVVEMDDAEMDDAEMDDAEMDDVEMDVVEVGVVAEESGDGDDEDDEDLLVLESVDEPWELPVWQPTGESRVDEALEGLTRIDMDGVHSHAGAYAEIHQQLRSTLSDLDSSS